GVEVGAVAEVLAASPLAVRLLGRRPAVLAALPLEQRLDGAPEEALRVVQAPQLVVADPRRRELGGESLELGAHLVRLADLPRRRPAHDRPAVRLELDDAARLQLAQRLADGCPRHAELARERLLAQALPRGELAGEDACVDRRGEAVDERWAFGARSHRSARG